MNRAEQLVPPGAGHFLPERGETALRAGFFAARGLFAAGLAAGLGAERPEDLCGVGAFARADGDGALALDRFACGFLL